MKRSQGGKVTRFGGVHKISLFDKVERVHSACVDRDVMYRKRFSIKPQVTQAVVVA